MFRGQVSVVRTGFSGTFPVLKWFLAGALGCLLILVVARTTTTALDPQWHRYLVHGLAYAFAAGSLGWLTLKLRPRAPKWVEATADHSGMFIDGVPLVLTRDIKQAYIRPHRDKQTFVTGPIAQRMDFSLPDYPLTVEIIRRTDIPLNIDPGGEPAAAALLTALGIPVTTCPPDYANQPPKKGRWGLTVVVMIVLLAALIGYAYYQYYTATHHGRTR
ncbi:MAG: hypothetical protein QOJ67_4248 [Acidimicrobiaceae bacterium]|jgi:hypothetical protein